MANFSDCKIHGANMGPICGRQDPGGTHVGPMNLAICVFKEGSHERAHKLLVMTLYA